MRRDIKHSGVKGMKWGVRNQRKYVNKDGTLTKKGLKKQNERNEEIRRLQNVLLARKEELNHYNRVVQGLEKNGINDESFHYHIGYNPKRDKRSIKAFAADNGLDLAYELGALKSHAHAGVRSNKQHIREIPKEIKAIQSMPIYRSTHMEAHRKAMRITNPPGLIAGGIAGAAAGKVAGHPIAGATVGAIVGATKASSYGLKLRDRMLAREDKAYGKIKHTGVKGMKWGVRNKVRATRSTLSKTFKKQEVKDTAKSAGIALASGALMNAYFRALGFSKPVSTLANGITAYSAYRLGSATYAKRRQQMKNKK